jgi:hypothetical protein
MHVFPESGAAISSCGPAHSGKISKKYFPGQLASIEIYFYDFA